MSQEHSIINIIPNSSGEKGSYPLGLYSLELSDRSMMPFFQPGAVFVFEQDSSDIIEDGDLVVYRDPENKGHFSRIKIGQETIILQGLNPSVPVLVLPKEHISRCDRLIEIILPNMRGRGFSFTETFAPPILSRAIC